MNIASLLYSHADYKTNADIITHVHIFGLNISSVCQELPADCDWEHGNFKPLLELVDYCNRKGVFTADPDVPMDYKPSPTAFAKLCSMLDGRDTPGQ